MPQKAIAQVDLVVIHCTGGEGWSLGSRTEEEYIADLRTYCMKPVADGGRGMETGAYHTIVFPSGRVHHYRPHSQRGQHASGHNWHSLGFAFVGNMDTHAPSMAAMHSMATEIARACFDEGLSVTIETVRPHNDLIRKSARQKTCPGDYVCMWLLRRMAHHALKGMRGA